MVKTIGNPLSWLANQAGSTGAHLAEATTHIGGDHALVPPEVQTITVSDLRQALRDGVGDFAAMRTDVAFVALVYPIIGVFLAFMAFNRDFMHLVFPVVSGFALVGPFAAIGLYEMSRQREATGSAGWSSALRVLASPSLGAIIVLGLFQIAIFAVWIGAADLVHSLTLGPATPGSVGDFVSAATSTGAGWAMILIGVLIGACFAALVLATSLVSFPLLLDRNVGLPVAVTTSVEVARRNPVTVAVWGLIVAAALVVGSLPFLLGLIVVMPILGHATWHLYRRAVS